MIQAIVMIPQIFPVYLSALSPPLIVLSIDPCRLILQYEHIPVSLNQCSWQNPCIYSSGVVFERCIVMISNGIPLWHSGHFVKTHPLRIESFNPVSSSLPQTIHIANLILPCSHRRKYITYVQYVL